MTEEDVPETIEVNSDAGAIDSSQEPFSRSNHSVNTSAADMARSVRAWTTWSQVHKIRPFDEQAYWENEEFDDFMKNCKYPNVLKCERENIVELLQYMGDVSESAVEDIRSWIENICSEKLEDIDRYNFRGWFPHICASWKSFINAKGREKNKSSCRKGVDNIIEVAFELRPNSDHVWQSEMELVLPDKPNKAVANTITSKDLPERWQSIVHGVPNNFTLRWSYSTSIPLSIITSAFEAKANNLDTAIRQITMDFYSAQLHRRALCCNKDGPVFGTILNQESLTFYVSYWDGDELPILQRPYSLTFLPDLLESYFILCRISEFQSQWLENEFRQWDSDIIAQRSKLFNAVAKRPWRGEKRSDKGPTSGAPQAGGTGSAGQSDMMLDKGSVDSFDFSEGGHPLTVDDISACSTSIAPQKHKQSAFLYRWLREAQSFIGHYKNPNTDLWDNVSDDEAYYENDNIIVVDCDEPVGDGLQIHGEDTHPSDHLAMKGLDQATVLFSKPFDNASSESRIRHTVCKVIAPTELYLFPHPSLSSVKS
ncbi:uncharacterized protein FOMMEDRAFT_160402 [Fomitiporia mediterranea MF3/22]|uniref:uncharacterized protein n=1 Tax=Fomitiporia mediterranea (strain MF3/22) TaxID=694068 RepID=UPI0004407D9C|nr:uncharacterized protein FOMMEDRAFT_160402 [Fomitiporia mediterranea MF3/22]EJC99927.1 hypothetical protein FOMMEDRAFT_160402 [Fomitiporia mediterranea MF3/22]